jgi:hypothetical protein
METIVYQRHAKKFWSSVTSLHKRINIGVRFVRVFGDLELGELDLGRVCRVDFGEQDRAVRFGGKWQRLDPEFRQLLDEVPHDSLVAPVGPDFAQRLLRELRLLLLAEKKRPVSGLAALDPTHERGSFGLFVAHLRNDRGLDDQPLWFPQNLICCPFLRGSSCFR